MSDPTDTIVHTYTTIIIIAVVVPLVITGIGVVAVFAYKRQRERDFVPPSLANMPGTNNGSLPVTAPPLPVQVRHVQNARNGTLIEWPSPNPLTSPEHQPLGTHPSSDPAEDPTNTSPSSTLDLEARTRRNVQPELLPTPYSMTYSAAQSSYPAQSYLPAASYLPSQPPYLYPQLPIPSMPTFPSTPFPAQPSSTTPQLAGPTRATIPAAQMSRPLNPRVLMLVNDDASRSTSPSQGTEDSSTLRGACSIGSVSTIGEAVPQYEPVDSAVLSEEPEQVADLGRGRQGTLLPRYSQAVSQTNPFRRGLVSPAP